MGFKQNRSNRSDQSGPNTDSSKHSMRSRIQHQVSQTASNSEIPQFRNQAHAEAHYGQEIESSKEPYQLQRLEKRYDDYLHGWLEEGIPKGAMGDPHEMGDFRIQRAVEGMDTSREDVPETVLEVVGDDGQPLPETIQRSLEGTGTSRDDVPGVVLDVLGSQGQSLDGTIQRPLEDRLSADFSDGRESRRRGGFD